MSREILFKAKRKNWKELPKEQWWVESFYSHNPNSEKAYITSAGSMGFAHPYQVDSHTNCQYTGLTDKYNNKIWENDICTVAGEDGYFTVEWDDDRARFVLNGDGVTIDFDNCYGHECEVIGNVFDDPELLGREG